MAKELTDEQLKAAKSVFRAMKKAGRLGVHFWDNYGLLTAYNHNAITCPNPEIKIEKGMISMDEDDPTYWENLSNFHAGNADDELHYKIKEE